MQQPRGLPVVVIGAGLGGLTLAIALRGAGFGVRVFERASELSEVGAGITLWHNALRCLDQLGVGQAVRAVGRRAEGGMIALANGKRLVERSAEELRELGPLSELMTYHRAELQRVLFEQLPEGTVEFGASAVGYETGTDAVVKLERNGNVEHEHAWLVVGADGIGSSIRAQMLGDEPRYAGYTCWRGICPIPEGWGGVCGEFWGQGDRFGLVEIPGHRLYWFAVVSAPARTHFVGGEEGKAELSRRFADYAFDVRQVIDATPADAIIFRDIVDRAPRRGWSDGNVTLLGDAAHATTPNMGQGAAMALESAVVLTRCLQRCDSLPAALTSYEATRFPRTRWITETSLRVGRMAHWENPLLRGFRNLLFSNLPSSAQNAQLRKLTDYDAMTVPL